MVLNEDPNPHVASLLGVDLGASGTLPHELNY